MHLCEASQRFLKILKIGRHAFARMFGAVNRITHFALNSRNPRREIGDEHPTDDREGGKSQWRGAAKFVGDFVGHSNLLP